MTAPTSQQQKPAAAAAPPGLNPMLASMLNQQGGGGGGGGGISPEMTQAAMSALPKLIAWAQRVPALTVGFFLGIIIWTIVLPLTSSSVFGVGNSNSGDVIMMGKSSSSSSSSLFGSLLGGSGSSSEDQEWDADVDLHEKKGKSSKNKNKNNKKQKQQQALFEDEDDEEEENSSDDVDSRQRRQRGKQLGDGDEKLSSFSRIRQCHVVRGHSLLRCMYGINNLLLTVIVGLLMIAFVSTGAAVWWRNRQDEINQHERAKNIVEDIVNMNHRNEKFD